MKNLLRRTWSHRQTCRNHLELCGLAAFRTLKPGDSFRKQVDITKWFTFEKADSYQITGMYELEFHNADFDSKVIWEEIVAGRCVVKIVE